MKANNAKTCFNYYMWNTVSKQVIKASSSKELLGIKIDSNHTFHDHIISLEYQSTWALNKKRILMKSYIFSQFNYCPLVWMCHSRSLNNKINWIQERALWIVYSDHWSSFKELLQKDQSITIHQRNYSTLQ